MLQRLTSFLLGVAVISISFNVAIAADFITFDNFDDQSGLLNRRDWYSVTTDRHGLEIVRLIIQDEESDTPEGSLYLSITGYGKSKGAKARRMSSQGLGMNISQPVRELQADIAIPVATVKPCDMNKNPAQARAQLAVYFFSTVSDRIKKRWDYTGDILTVFEKIMDHADGPFIRATVLQCQDSKCGDGGETTKAVRFTSKWEPNQMDTMRISWNPKQKLFRFSLNPESKGESRTISYPEDWKPNTPLGWQRQRIRAKVHSPDCPGTRIATHLYMRVDNVKWKPLTDSEKVSLIDEVEVEPLAAKEPADAIKDKLRSVVEKE